MFTKITHITHSAFMVETQDNCLLFDYFMQEKIPHSSCKNLYIFASHGHADHFNIDILGEYEKGALNYDSVQFIFSYDIKRKYIDLWDTLPLDLLERITFMMPNKSIKIDEIEVSSIGSTDLGVAFLVSLNEMVLFHAGDLHLWIWDDQSYEENKKMQQRYEKEIAKIKDKQIDYAFYPVDIRQEEIFLDGLIYFLENTKASKVFPMHYFGHYETTKLIFDNEKVQPYLNRIQAIKNKNEVFNF